VFGRADESFDIAPRKNTPLPAIPVPALEVVVEVEVVDEVEMVVVDVVVDELEVVVWEVVADDVEVTDFEDEVEDEVEELVEKLDESEALEVLDDEEELEDAAGLMASTMTPKSLPCGVPNERAAPDMEAERTSYWEYASWPDLEDCIRVIPDPAVCRVDPVSPPTWNKNEPAGAEIPVSQGAPQPSRLAWATGNPAAKGWAAFAPETAKATMPYHVSPVDVVWTITLSLLRTSAEIAYQVSSHWFPPMVVGPVLGMNVRPSASFTDHAPPPRQSQPTMITSEGFVVDSDTEQEVAYPHPASALPSRVGCGVAPTTGPIPAPITAEITKRRATPNERILRGSATGCIKIEGYLKLKSWVEKCG
jgi:hypothetical protein